MTADGTDHGWRRECRRMIESQIRRRGVRDPRLLEAMAEIPRHRFVPSALREAAYADYALPIAAGQTISQPYIVALMTDQLGLTGAERVLEIGTGSGYQTALLSRLAGEVWTVEIVPELQQGAREALDGLGCRNVRYRVGDGRDGWPEAAPFDGVLVTAAPEVVPPALGPQLVTGGRMVVPVGVGIQDLQVLTRLGDGRMDCRSVLAVRFVPLVSR